MSPRENIEDTIISDIESNTGDDFNVEPNTGGEDTGSRGNSSAEPSSSAEPTQRGQQDGNVRNNEPKPNGKDGKGKKDQQQQPRRDEKGNIVDQQGNVVAAKGVERRLHHQNERLKETNGHLTSKVSQLEQQLQNYSVINGMPHQHGLEPADLPEALRIAGVMKRDPAAGAREALQYALAQGVNLHSIVTGQGIQDISLAAQRRMFQEHNMPQQMERHRQQQIEQTRQNVARFLANYPAAEIHQEDISKMIPEIIKRSSAEGRNIDPYTAGEIALRTLQNFAMEKGLDPNRSIQEQIDERVQQQQQRPNGQQQQQRDVRRPPPRQQAPMANGSRGNQQVDSRSGSLPATSSTDAIVRQAMAANGYNFGS